MLTSFKELLKYTCAHARYLQLPVGVNNNGTLWNKWNTVESLFVCFHGNSFWLRVVVSLLCVVQKNTLMTPMKLTTSKPDELLRYKMTMTSIYLGSLQNTAPKGWSPQLFFHWFCFHLGATQWTAAAVFFFCQAERERLDTCAQYQPLNTCWKKKISKIWVGAYNCVCLCVACIFPFAMYGHFHRYFITQNNIMKCLTWTEEFSSTVSLGFHAGTRWSRIMCAKVCCVCQISTKLESMYETFRPLQIQVLPPHSL